MRSNLFRAKATGYLLSILILVGLLFFCYIYIFKQPYLGFNVSMNVITQVFSQPAGSDALRIGDKILKLGDTEWQTYMDHQLSATWSYHPDDSVPITIERGQQTLEVNWVIPKPDQHELISRFATAPLLLLPFLFAASGMIALFFLRPKDLLRDLLAASFFLTGIWIAAGAVSSTNIYFSSEIFHIAIWLFWPVIWHLNWIYPKPLKPISPAWWIWLYAVACLLAVADLLRWFPFNAYPIPMLLAAAGFVVLLLLHLIFQPDQRRLLLQFISLSAIALIPGLIYILTASELKSTPYIGYVAIMPIGLMPLAHMYPIYHRQLGKYELRANQLITLWAYCVIVIAFSSLIILAQVNLAQVRRIPPASGIITIVLVGLTAIALYPNFHRWFEAHLLGMPIPPTDLLSTFAGRIVTSLDKQRLAQLFDKEILPSLLISQASLVCVEEIGTEGRYGPITPIYSLDVPLDLLPSTQDVPMLIARAGRFYPPPEHPESSPCPWARLVLPLKVDQRLIGLCLLGRRAPDDYYAPTELGTLQALMDQTALALVNIDQAQQLHMLYRQDIERDEVERNRIALDLHDDVLGQMTLLAHSIDPDQASPQFSAAYQASVQHIREIIAGLRPPLLNFGLRAALDGLADEFLPPEKQKLAISIDVPASEHRYPEEVETHLYRIVQQACKNAIQHSQARQIVIMGSLEAQQVDLTIGDDGIGFDAQQGVDLPWLLAHQHYGLAGMVERAAVIGATLQLDSAPGSGTRVKIFWNCIPPGAK
jgi:signal transduction histidine kinase